MSATLSEEVMSLKKLILRNPVSSACVGIFNVNEVRISELMWYKVIIIIFLWPTGTNPQAEILKLNNVNGCNDISFGDHSILEGDHILPLKSHGQALEEELLFPWCPQ